jgi:methylase of polypeptide subunit release factors
MTTQVKAIDKVFRSAKEQKSWNDYSKKELKMHQIHVYPAKFPSFIVTRAIKYVERKKTDLKIIGDVFCGCGTTALEAKLNGKDFWGCDINPVATLIAKTKSNKFKTSILRKYFEIVINKYRFSAVVPNDIANNERINYWFEKQRIGELYGLLKSINENVAKGKYRDFFLVAFSNILKSTSLWLTKSIKPQKDNTKITKDVLPAFRRQFQQMLKATEEINAQISRDVKCSIHNKNLLKITTKAPFLDLLISSPPYVTSYEYADLHQLSTLWLGFTKDYRLLRNGTIGSVYHADLHQNDKENLNSVGKNIYEKLLKTRTKNKKSILKYFLDMEATIKKCQTLVKDDGYVAFVIGNTKYKGVYIDNAQYLAQCLIDNNFTDIEVKKRKITSKILTPYRDKKGKFSTNKKHRKVYSHEYILIARKNYGR